MGEGPLPPLLEPLLQGFPFKFKSDVQPISKISDTKSLVVLICVITFLSVGLQMREKNMRKNISGEFCRFPIQTFDLEPT